MTHAVYARIDAELAGMRAAGRLRTLDERDTAQRALVSFGGRDFVNFTSNDYLGLAADPRVVARVHAELRRHGFGSGSAALLGGRSTLHAELERELASYLGMPAALLFSSGYLANLGALTALIDASDHVVHDRLNHASLIDAVIATRARHHRYPHCDAVRASALLGGETAKAQWLVTESVFSMDGDIAPLEAIDTLTTTREAMLYVDDAHGFGVINGGPGVARSFPPERRHNHVFMMTLGKTLGSVGGVVLAAPPIIEFLIQRARTFIYDTALPSVCAAAALEALAILRSEPSLVTRLQSRIAQFRRLATSAGLGLSDGTTAIQPILIGDDRHAVAVAQTIQAAGYYVRAIRPPTVPTGTARLRITLTALHTDEQIAGLIDALASALRP